MQNNLFRKIFCIWVTTIFLVNQFAGVSHALFCQVGTSMYGGTIIGNITTGADADKEGKLDSTRNSMSTAEPVLIPNGEFVFNAQDLAIPARGIPLVISRVYRNQREFNGAYGFGWFFNFQRALRKMDNNNIMLIDGSRGRKDEFVPTGLGNYKSPAGIYDKLKQNTDGTFTLTSKYGVVQNFDINGLLSKISDRNGNAITFAYKKNRVPLAIQSKYIPTQSASVVMMILPIESITDATGRSLTFEYDPRGRLSKIKDFAGREILYGYDVYDNLATVTDAMGQVVTYGYDDKHNLTTITDAKKQVFLTNKYDPKDRIYEQTYGAGTFLFSYDEANRQTTITDRNGFKTRVTFNTNDIPVKVEQFTAGVRPGDPTVYITTYEYNADFEVRQKTLPNGNIIKYSYYADTSNLYSESQYPLSTTLPAPPNINTTLSYESKFNQIKTIQDPKNNITTLLYDYELPTTDPDYGTKGNLVKITHPLVNGQTPIEKFSYNTYGQLIKATDANNNVTQYAYDPLTGYLLEVAKDPQGINAVTKYGYDAYGNINSITDPNGHIFKATFNKNNKVVEKTDALGFKSKLSYDENNNLKTVEQQVDALATQWRKTSYTYTLTDKIKTITDPLNQVTIYDYDANENVIAITDALNRVTQLVYDERNLLYKQIDANSPSGVVTYTYDPNQNLKLIKDQNNNTTTYGYDDFGRMTKLTYANNSFLKNEYDLNSNVIRVTNPAGQVIEYDYDNLNRVTAKRFPATAALNSTLTYDPGSRLKTAITPNVSLSWTYDNLDRIKTVAQVVGGFSYTTGYSYDKAGNRIQLQYPSGKLVDYTFDNNNRPDLIKVNTVKLADYNFDPLSRRQNRTVFTGTNQFQTVYSFDLANQLKSLTNNVLPNTLLSQYSYPLYDKVGNRKSMTRKLATFSQTLDYTYNNIDEITAVSGSVTQSFNYDNVNNRTLANGVSYVPNNLNQYTAVGGVTYAYDTNGNLTSNGANTYTYDEENRLKSVTNTTNTASYGYDAFNRRISKTVNGVTTNFVYDGDEIIADYNTSGGLVAEYVYGGELDEILTMQKGSTVYYYHTDGLGSVTEVTTSTGAFAERYAYTYDAFGKPVIVNASNAVVSNTVIGNRYMFTGREYDSESGTYYFRARNYDPGIGRFLQRDPIGYGDGMNPYAYTSNNPINLVDPYGLTGMWYDRLSGWSHGQTNQAKDALFSTIGGSRSGAYTAATIATVMDFGMGVFDTPSAIGHLGEGTGCFMARPSLENASGMLMDVSLIAGILAGVGSQLNKPYYRYTYEGSKPTYDLRGRINDKTWLSDRKFYSLGDAHNELALPKPPTDVETVKVPWWKYIEGPRPAQSVPGWGRGGAPEYRVGGF